MGRKRKEKKGRLAAMEKIAEERTEKNSPCVNVLHDQIDCATARFPSDQWCEPCKNRERAGR